MSNVTVQKGNTLWGIVKKEFNLTNNTDIAKKVKELAKANNLKNGGNSIFVGQTISFEDKKAASGEQQPATNAVATNPVTKQDPVNPVQTPAVETIGTKFDDWTMKIAKGEKPEAFDFVGSDFLKDITENKGQNAGTIYKNGALNFAKSYINLYDKMGINNDGKIDFNEFKAKEIADAKKAYPDMDIPYDEEVSKKGFTLIDQNDDGFIDEQEEAAAIAVIDKNPKTRENNGKISIDEFVDTSKALANDSLKETMQAGLKEAYAMFFGKK